MIDSSVINHANSVSRDIRLVQKKMNPTNDCFAKFDSDQLAKTCAFLVWNQSMQHSAVFVNAMPIAFGMMNIEDMHQATHKREKFHRNRFPRH